MISEKVDWWGLCERGMRRRGWRQIDLVRAAGLKENAGSSLISKMKRGATPSHANLVLLARAFGHKTPEQWAEEEGSNQLPLFDDALGELRRVVREAVAAAPSHDHRRQIRDTLLGMAAMLPNSPPECSGAKAA